jgi:hypothetical protein
MKKLFSLLIIGLFSISPASSITTPHFSATEIQQIVDQALDSDNFGFLPYERKALKIFQKALATVAPIANKASKIIHSTKKDIKKIAKTSYKTTKKAAKHSYNALKTIPFVRIAKDAATIAIPMAKGCISGIVAGAPLGIGLALETYGAGTATVTVASCAIGALITSSPALFKVAYRGVKDLYKSKKLKDEIKINREDLDQFKLQLSEAESYDTQDLSHEERALHLDQMLTLNRQITAIELYIQELKKARRSLRA